jgi:hypothetical protein
MKLGHGDVHGMSNKILVPSSHYLSPFAILLASDNDDDWALVPDHRLRVLKYPVQLDLTSLNSESVSAILGSIKSKKDIMPC